MENTDNIAVVDFEMPDIHGSHICAAGICTVKDGKVDDTYYSLIDPQCKFDASITDITGLSAESVKGAPSFKTAWEDTRPLLEGKIIVAHGAANDMRALSKTLKNNGIGWHPRVNYLCTFMMAQTLLPAKTKLGLDRLCGRYSIELSNHHNALSDAHACAELYLTLCKEYPDTEFTPMLFNMTKAHSEKTKPPIRKESAAIITNELCALANEEYAERKKKSRPTWFSDAKVLGVTPEAMKQIAADPPGGDDAAQAFLCALPHTYFEEDFLHSCFINLKRKQAVCIKLLEKFLPYVHNPYVIRNLRPHTLLSSPSTCKEWLDEKIACDIPALEAFACECFARMFLRRKYSSEMTDAVAAMKNPDDICVQDSQVRYFADAFIRHSDEITALLDSDKLPDSTKRLTVQAIFAKVRVPWRKKEDLRLHFISLLDSGK